MIENESCSWVSLYQDGVEDIERCTMLFLGARSMVCGSSAQFTSTVSMHLVGQRLESKRQSLHLCWSIYRVFRYFHLSVLSFQRFHLFWSAQSKFYSIDPLVWLFSKCSLNKDDNLVCCLFPGLVASFALNCSFASFHLFIIVWWFRHLSRAKFLVSVINILRLKLGERENDSKKICTYITDFIVNYFFFRFHSAWCFVSVGFHVTLLLFIWFILFCQLHFREQSKKCIAA